jgi:dTDP-4-amino-4,6-dideoxygalactose transaminase
MTTGGEGGMVTTNDKKLWRQMWSFKDHGKSYEAVYERQHPPGFRWLHEGFGTNWRMLEIQAVLGRIQLKKMPTWTEQRHNNVLKLSQAIQPFSGAKGSIRLPDYACNGCSRQSSLNKNETCSIGCTHGQYKFYVYVQPDNLAPAWTRDRIIEAINDLNVPCFQGSCSEVYLEKAFDGTGWRPKERLPVAKELGENSLMFLVHPTLTSTEIDKTCQAIGSVLSDATSHF